MQIRDIRSPITDYLVVNAYFARVKSTCYIFKMDENTNNAMDDWKKRPMMVPITIRLQPGLHSQEVHIMHPLNADVSSEFVEREASELAKQANGDAYVCMQFS